MFRFTVPVSPQIQKLANDIYRKRKDLAFTLAQIEDAIATGLSVRNTIKMLERQLGFPGIMPEPKAKRRKPRPPETPNA